MVRVVGVFCLLHVVAGAWYIGMIAPGITDDPVTSDYPYFKIAYFSMTAVCILFLSALGFIGLKLTQKNDRYFKWLLTVLVSEIAYIFIIGLSWGWAGSEYVPSIAAATGVANGGLMFQGLSGFVLWAPLILWFSARKRAA
jgi:hypothetical protein